MLAHLAGDEQAAEQLARCKGRFASTSTCGLEPDTTVIVWLGLAPLFPFG